MSPIADSEGLVDPCVWPDVAAYLRGLGEERGPVWSRIHPSDEMYLYERSIPFRSREAAAIGYFATGHQIHQTVREIVEWRFGGFTAVRGFLDFASGYGRLTRFLVGALPAPRVTVAEIDSSAVRFQEDAFGVAGLVSHADPGRLRLSASFDVVFAASFFSHLPASSFEPWLRRLRSARSSEGVLLFSVHGMHLLPETEADASGEGIVFRPVSETARLDGAEYGTSYVTEEFVRGAVARAGGGRDRLFAFPRGLCGLQDLYVLLAPPGINLPDPHPSRCPFGTSDASRIEDGVVTVEGWAQGDLDERPPDVRLYLRDALWAHLPGEPSAAAGSRRRWSFSFPLSAVDPDGVVRVEAQSARGASSLLVVGSTRPYLPAPPL